MAAEGDEGVAAGRWHYTGTAEGDATKWWQLRGYSPGVAAEGPELQVWQPRGR